MLERVYIINPKTILQANVKRPECTIKPPEIDQLNLFSIPGAMGEK